MKGKLSDRGMILFTFLFTFGGKSILRIVKEDDLLLIMLFGEADSTVAPVDPFAFAFGLLVAIQTEFASATNSALTRVSCKTVSFLVAFWNECLSFTVIRVPVEEASSFLVEFTSSISLSLSKS